MRRRVSHACEGVDRQSDADGPEGASRAPGVTESANDEQECNHSHGGRLGERRFQHESLQGGIQRCGELATHAGGFEQIVKGDEDQGCQC